MASIVQGGETDTVTDDIFQQSRWFVCFCVVTVGACCLLLLFVLVL